jgi:hypothetical protein
MPRTAARPITVASQKKTDPARVVKPAVTELPPSLTLQRTVAPLPAVVCPPEVRLPQPFFSALERVFPEFGVGDDHARCWTGLPESEIVAFEQETPDDGMAWRLTTADGVRRPVFLKRAHLLDPTDAMSGAYLTPHEGGLPAPFAPWQAALRKLNDPLNEAYVDALFALYANKMVTSGLSPHWCRCYGTYTARIETYLYDITEEYDSLKREPWWHKNQRARLFTLFNEDESDDEGFRALSDREGISLDPDEFEALEEEVVAKNTVACSPSEESVTATAATVAAPSEEEPVKLRTPRIRFKQLNADRESQSEHSSSETSGAHYAEFHDFPVQMTLLERADETLEDLSEEEIADPAQRDACWSAWLFQIIAGLAVAQHYFGFAHNDLHSNNVMWSATDQEFLYYRVVKGKTHQLYKVPTYGKIMKIIDFGRASYTIPEPGGFFISDAFYPGNDAAEQYNCEPFYNPKEGPRLEPNPSFDLCRLAVSLLDSLFPERPAAASPLRVMSRDGGKTYYETVSPVYNLLWEWLLDDEGKSVLRTPDGKERYPDFDLYCALAADVHRAIPRKQIEKAHFSAFRVSTEVPPSTPVYELHV